MNFNVNADLFRNVARAVSEEKTRYYLNGVLIQPHPCGGTYLVATDGHRMIVAYDPQGATDRDYIVPAPRDLLRVTKRKKERGMQWQDARRIVATGEAVQVREDSDILASLDIAAIDGTFPDWQRIVPPADAAGNASAHNPAYVSDLMDMAVELNSCGWSGLLPRMHSRDDSSPTVVSYGGNAPVFAILMPMRADDAARPAFFGARPYDSPRVALSALDTRYPYEGEAFEVTTTRSPLHKPETRRYVFSSKAAAVRAFNRYRAALVARGVAGLPDPILPSSDIPEALLEDRKRRVRAIDNAAAAFTEATDQDIAMPWRRALLPQTQTRTIKNGRRTFTVTEAVQPMHAVSGLPHLSEARLLATAYRIAA